MKFTKSRSLLLLLSVLSVPQAHAVNNISRVSIDSVNANENANGVSIQGAVSADGRYVVFESAATDIIAGDTNGVRDIFRYDRQTDTMARVSVSSGGAQSNGTSIWPDISADGRYVVFASRATNIVSGVTYPGLITNPDDPMGPTVQPFQIFIRDMNTSTTSLVTFVNGTSSSNAAANHQSNKPAISGDGNFVAYESLATDILAADSDSHSDIYRFNRAGDVTALVSRNDSDTKGNEKSEEASISYTGQYVAFASDASNIGSFDLVTDVFVRDVVNGTTTTITSGASGAGGFTDSQQPVISGNGDYVAFESFREDLVNTVENNTTQDVFLYHIPSQTYRLISQTPAGQTGDARSGHPGISYDGRYVVFESFASNFVTGDTNGVLDVYVRDTFLNTTTRVSLNESGAEGPNLSQKPRISMHGRFIVFSSENGQVTADTNGQEDTYVFQRPIHTGHDLNGDSRSDIVWRNGVSGFNWAHFMNGATISSTRGINVRAPSDYRAVGIGDFNNDGKDDLIYRDISSGATRGQVIIDLYNGTNITQSAASGASNTNMDWEIIGIGDFNDDGFDDLVWQNTATEEVRFTLLERFTLVELTSFGTLPTGFTLAGIGDFDGDGKEDMLWRNQNNGINWIHHLNGTQLKSQGFSSQIPSTDWQVAGVGDFDADSKTDIIWRNSVTGYYRIHLIDGTTIKSNLPHVRNTDMNWDIELVSDFNGDGMADIFQRNAVTGRNWLKIMNGGTITSSQAVNPLFNTNFSVIEAD